MSSRTKTTATRNVASAKPAEPAAGLEDRDTPDQFGVQSVEIAARILKALAAVGGTAPLKRLSVATAMPRAKVHRYLVSLRRAGLIAQETDGQYRIGPAAVTIGLVGLGRSSPVRQISEVLPRLRDRIDETVVLAIWGEMGPTVIAIEESSHVVTMNVRVGSILSVSGTAIGRVFATYLPASVTQSFIAAERGRGQAAAPSATVLAGLVDEVRKRKLSRVHGAVLPGVDAIAAPVFDHRGQLMAVICAVGRTEAMNTDWDGPIARALDEAATALSHQLGFIGPG